LGRHFKNISFFKDRPFVRARHDNIQISGKDFHNFFFNRAELIFSGKHNTQCFLELSGRMTLRLVTLPSKYIFAFLVMVTFLSSIMLCFLSLYKFFLNIIYSFVMKSVKYFQDISFCMGFQRIKFNGSVNRFIVEKCCYEWQNRKNKQDLGCLYSALRRS